MNVKEEKFRHGYVIWLRFSDGAEGEVDLQKELDGEVFAPRKDKRAFRRFRVDPELAPIVWENGADLAPEYLCERLKVLAEPSGAANLATLPADRRRASTMMMRETNAE